MKHLLATLLTTLTLILTTGCSAISSKYQVTVDAITAPNLIVTPSTYKLKALKKDVDSNGLRFQQYARTLAKVLHEKGYLKTMQGETAKQTIYFDYGIEKVKEEKHTYIEPAVSFHVGFGFPHGAFYLAPFGYYDPFYDPIYYGIPYYHSTTTNYYNRYITILAKDQFSKELWRVDVSSVGESKNLRKIIPLLIEASKPYLGTTTKEPIELVVKEKKEEKR